MCTYPTQRTSCASTRLHDSNERIEKLEIYIRRLGGDPSLLNQAINDGTDIQHAEQAPSTVLSELDALQIENAETGNKRDLVEHDEQIPYTDLYAQTISWFQSN